MTNMIQPKVEDTSCRQDTRFEGKPMFAVVNCDTGDVVATFHSWNNGEITLSNPNKISIATALGKTKIAVENSQRPTRE